MPKYNANVDKNQSEIVGALRAAGCSVSHTHTLGKGFPDIVVGFRGHNYLLEIKRPEMKGRKREFTPDELAWMETWRGNCFVVYTIDDALRAVGAME